MPISLSVSLPAIPDFQANGYLLLGRLQFCNSSDQTIVLYLAKKTIFLYSPRKCNKILIDDNSGYLCARILQLKELLYGSNAYMWWRFD